MGDHSVQEDICYNKNYLTKVIARLDFLNEITELSTQLPPEISKCILLIFPISEPQEAVARELQLTKENVQQKSEKKYTQWTFYGREREKKLIIVPKIYLIEHNRYKYYADLRDEFIKVVQTLFNTYPQIVCNRLGLRYINTISFENGDDPLSWEELVNEKLLSVLDFYPEKKYIARSFHNLGLNYGEYNIRYQFGIINPDYPAVVRKKSFILDLDAYYQGSIDQNNVGKSLDKYHDRIQEIFEMSITSRMRDILNE